MQIRPVPGNALGEFVQPVNGDACQAKPGYSDVTGGAQVTITDDDGRTIAVTRVKSFGFITDAGSGGLPMHALCKFMFSIDELPKANFYGVRVGNEERGTVTFKESEAEHGSFDLRIG